MAERSPEEIRASIERNRAELATSVTALRHDIERITDWRGFVARNRKQIIIGAAVTGFVIGGGIAAVGGFFRRG
jgi:hypothetical protein